MGNSFPWFNTRIGSQTIGPRYYFTDLGALVETAHGLLEMGSDVIKFNLSAGAYPDLVVDPSLKTLRDLAEKHPDFRTVFDLPFHYYLFWAHPKLNGMGATLDYSVEQEQEIYDEVYQLSVYLLEHYNNSGKVFLIGQWEADWVLLGCFDPEQDVPDQHLKGMIRYLSVRQQAVEDARRKTAHTNVWVGHFAEVNRPLDAKLHNKKRMTNEVLPQVPVDLVSYSAYDALWPNRLTEALDYIESKARFTTYFDGMFEKKVFIGEYDAYRDYHQRGYYPPEIQLEHVLDVMTSGLSWGVPFILFWEYYNNEHERLVHGGGFWLVDDQGIKQPVYYLHRTLLAKINAMKNLYRYWYGRNPLEGELNAWADLLSRKRLSQLLMLLLDAPAYQQTINDEQFAGKVAEAMFDTTNHLMAAQEIVLETMKQGLTRSQALLALWDSPLCTEAVPFVELRRALKLDKQVLDPVLARSAMWTRYLDRTAFLDEELSLRFDSGNAEWLRQRYFPRNE